MGTITGDGDDAGNNEYKGEKRSGRNIHPHARADINKRPAKINQPFFLLERFSAIANSSARFWRAVVDLFSSAVITSPRLVNELSETLLR